jgi:hypothetical protein
MSATSSSLSSSQDQNLIDHLRSFLHLTTQAPLEYVCRSALYLLNHVPSTRHAVLEYIGTFYKVATFLHLRYNLNQKNPNYQDLATDTNNINHINQVIDLIESSLNDLLKSSSGKSLWATELAQWLVELIGDIVHNTGNTFADTQGLTSEEIASFRQPTINDGLEIWSSQCRPTQSILVLIKKCFDLVDSSQTKETILDLLLNASSKFLAKFDWILCYFTSLDAECLFQKLLTYGFKEHSTDSKLHQQQQQQQKLLRINVINFYSSSYPYIVCKQIIDFLASQNSDEKRIFLLKLAAQSQGLLNILLNQMLDSYSSQNPLETQLKHFLANENAIKNDLFECLTQLNNSTAVYDLTLNILEWLSTQNESSSAKPNSESKRIIDSIVR